MPPSARVHHRGLWLVAAFKLFKGVVLLAVGIGFIKSLHHDAAAALERWADVFRIDTGNAHFQRLVDWISFLNHRKLKELGAGTFFYSALMLTEGVGLSLQRQWAEYFSLIATCGFLPLEIYELIRRVTVAKVGVLIANIAVIIYLVVVIQSSRRAST